MAALLRDAAGLGWQGLVGLFEKQRHRGILLDPNMTLIRGYTGLLVCTELIDPTDLPVHPQLVQSTYRTPLVCTATSISV